MENSHSKSPESETTTVPVCLRRSRELDMVVEGEEEGVGEEEEAAEAYKGRSYRDLPAQSS